MALTNVTFQLGPDVTVTSSSGSILLSPISGASLQVNALAANSTPTGSIDVTQAGVLEFTLNIPPGAQGNKGDDGDDGIGITAITSSQGGITAGETSVATISFALSNNTTQSATINIPAGAPGTAGSPGDDGQSAYQIAVAGGYTGTQDEWVASLKGAQGLSAYQIAVNGGYSGTQDEWVASLKGEKGDPGPAGPIADITDWTSQNAVNARSAMSQFAQPGAQNTFTKDQWLLGGSANSNGSTSPLLHFDNTSATVGTLMGAMWVEQNTQTTASNYLVINVVGTDSTNTAFNSRFIFHSDGSLSTPLGAVANCGVTNTFTPLQTFTNGLVGHSGIGSVNTSLNYGAYLYVDSQAKLTLDLDVVGTTNQNASWFRLDPQGTASTSLGTLAFSTSNNNFTTTQTFRNNINVTGVVTITNTGVNDTAELYVDSSSNLTLDLNSGNPIAGTTNLSWLRLSTAGVLTTSAGTMARTVDLPFYGQSTGQRIQSFTTSGAIASGGFVAFPIAFSSVVSVLAVALAGSYQQDEWFSVRIGNFIATGFYYYGNTAQQLSVIAVGYY